MAPKKSQKQEEEMHFISSDTDLFTEPGVDITILNTNEVTYHAQNNLADKSAPLSFFIPGNDSQYINTAECNLFLRCKIVDGKGADYGPTADKAKYTYAPINNLIHSMFKSVDIKLKDTQITHNNCYYPYRAYMEKQLSYGKNYKKTQGEAGMFYKTKSEKNTTDDGWVRRETEVSSSKPFELYGRPHSELFSQTRLLIPGVDIRVDFVRSPDAFCIQTAGTDKGLHSPQLIILEAKLLVTKHTIRPSLALNHAALIQSGHHVVYPSRENEMKAYVIAKGEHQNTNETLLSGVLPDRIVLGFVNSEHIHGTYASNPLIFEDFGVSHITVALNSDVQTVKHMDLDFAKNRFTQAYMSIFEGLGIANTDVCIDINKEEFKSGGKTLFVYDLQHTRDAYTPALRGNVSIDLKFNTALPHSITVMCYAEYQSVLYINRDKQVSKKDYSQD